jgi:hypothetical protein
MALEDATNPMQGVSGPGKFAKRTDLQYQSTGYGDGVAMQQQMQGAPVATTPDVRGATNTQVRQAAAQAAPQEAITSLFAPSNRPNEPVTTGAAIGPGAGPEALMMQSQFAQTKISDTLAQMLPYDQTGEIGILYQQALSRGM